MATRFNVIVARPGKDDKTFWHRIGTGWPRDKGGISVTLDSLPIPGKDGKVSMLIVDADAKGDAAPKAADKPRREEMDDEVPF
jgi:hypothetical protein